MNVDHIGYAVKNIDASRQAFEELGYVFDPVVNDTDRNIFISFGRLGDYRIELVSPLDPALPSPVDGTLKKSGNTPYHICYTSSRFEDDIKELQQKRQARCFPVSSPNRITGTGGSLVGFQFRYIQFQHLLASLLDADALVSQIDSPRLRILRRQRHRTECTSLRNRNTRQNDAASSDVGVLFNHNRFLNHIRELLRNRRIRHKISRVIVRCGINCTVR